MDEPVTIADLIAALQSYPADALVRINTADMTVWTALEVDLDGVYSEVWSGEPHEPPAPFDPNGDLS